MARDEKQRRGNNVKKTVVSILTLVIIANVVGFGVLYVSSSQKSKLRPSVLNTNDGANIDVSEHSQLNSKRLEVEDAAVKALNATPAFVASQKLISLFPDSADLITSSTTNTSSHLNFLCQPASSEPLPVLEESISLSPTNGTLGGGHASVLVYPPGLAEQAMKDLKNRVNSCGGRAYSVPSNVTPGSFTVYDNGSPNGSNVSGGNAPSATTVFRYGDVIGLVSVRNVELSAAPNTAKMWYERWGGVLTEEVCPNSEEGAAVSGAERNPLFSGYSGLKKVEPVSLTADQRTASNVVAVIKLRTDNKNGTSLRSSGVLPSSPLMFESPPDASLPRYPQGLKVELPEKPQPVAPPTFPSQPSVGTEIVISADDTVGPGCGWGFTKTYKPLFDEASASVERDERYKSAVFALQENNKGWVFARWQYVLQSKAYEDYVQSLRNWVNISTKAIATVWWSDYEQKKAQYDVDLARWQAEYLVWQGNNPECAVYYPAVESFSNEILEDQNYLKKKVSETRNVSSPTLNESGENGFVVLNVSRSVNRNEPLLSNEPDATTPPSVSPSPDPTIIPPQPQPTPSPVPTSIPPPPQPAPTYTPPPPQPAPTLTPEPPVVPSPPIIRPTPTPTPTPDRVVPVCPQPPKKPVQPATPTISKP